MGLFEDAANVVSNAINALKATPLTLASVLMNFALLIFLFWYTANILEQRRQSVSLILQMITETNKSLATCVSDSVIRDLIETVRHGRELQRQSPPLPPPQPP